MEMLFADNSATRVPYLSFEARTIKVSKTRFFYKYRVQGPLVVSKPEFCGADEFVCFQIGIKDFQLEVF